MLALVGVGVGIRVALGVGEGVGLGVEVAAALTSPLQAEGDQRPLLFSRAFFSASWKSF